MMKASSKILLLLLAAPLLARAELGQKLDAAQAASGGKQMTALAPAGGAFSVQQSQDAAGRLIKQYAAADGTVFAVAWSGGSLPDLQQLLGSYFPAYRQAQLANRNGLNVMRGQVGSFVVSSHGRMGAFKGFAYDSALLPAGVTPDQLK
ncbi:DUF2844 domain-containing protein [Chromobacterium subtsugae]|uniref:DUF2844 domain-containing protein n=2 Tax=Chromobacterium subtsugae TaxID=251747 RepID=A0ABS7FBN3_9NEIS|nr:MULTISPECIES: DUF2844 domain-containing protein [Chromobacterium]KUM03244.1 hypothetical protein Cv017_20700 [Chromobacterium subtsugae]KZE85161.1 hypothetical protein AWB61_20925 [Chromobacterium sp. F49]MBW7569064.1 DUF2844 domain-containing protein [Chromobacterium subtsugae]MBW8287407.1 DUF2844 domain-containing protein [Chromobacterium subtsugae]WSE93366.1 DUF2844 domain-containing protein [Chromobacterium subtsugae]